MTKLPIARLVMAVPVCWLAIIAFAPGACAQDAAERTSEQLTAPSSAPGAPDDALDLEAVSDEVVRKTNALRSEHDLAAVDSDDALTSAAQYFAEYMAKHGVYGHTADNQTPAQRAENHGYEYCIVLENIAYAYDSRGFDREQLVEKLYVGWRDSPRHRENMLDPDVTETGVAIAKSSDSGVYYGVQLFGLPKSAETTFSITNESGQTVEYDLGDESYSLPPRVTRTHTVCRTPELGFSFSDRSVNPTNGDAYLIEDGAEGLTVKQTSRTDA